MKQLIGIIVAITLLTMAGCNTMRGVGKDIEQGGKAIEKATR